MNQAQEPLLASNFDDYGLLLLRQLTKIGLRIPQKKVLVLDKIYKLCESIRQYYCHSSKKLLIKDFDGNLKIYLELSQHIDSQVFWRGSYSDNELIILEEYLKPDNVFLDIGANIGVFTLFAAKRLPSGTVFSFEPTSVFFTKLSANIKANKFNNIQAFRIACSDQEAQRNIYLPAERDKDESFNGGAASLFSENQKWNPLEEISVTTLDSFVQQHQLTHVDFIKIDVEGAELMVLRGAESVLNNFRPKLIVEVNSITAKRAGYEVQELWDYLCSLGYSIYGIMPRRRQGIILCDKNNFLKFHNILCLPTGTKN